MLCTLSGRSETSESSVCCRVAPVLAASPPFLALLTFLKFLRFVPCQMEGQSTIRLFRTFVGGIASYTAGLPEMLGCS